jgi:dGTPase
MTSKARRVVREIFLILFEEPELLPSEWRNQAENQEESSRARVIADYISGMTDRYALEVHKKLFDPDALS